MRQQKLQAMTLMGEPPRRRQHRKKPQPEAPRNPIAVAQRTQCAREIMFEASLALVVKTLNAQCPDEFSLRTEGAWGFRWTLMGSRRPRIVAVELSPQLALVPTMSLTVVFPPFGSEAIRARPFSWATLPQVFLAHMRAREDIANASARSRMAGPHECAPRAV